MCELMAGGGGGGLARQLATVAVGGGGAGKKGLFWQVGQVGQDALSLGQHGRNLSKMTRFGWLFERHFGLRFSKVIWAS